MRVDRKLIQYKLSLGNREIAFSKLVFYDELKIFLIKIYLADLRILRKSYRKQNSIIFNIFSRFHIELNRSCRLKNCVIFIYILFWSTKLQFDIRKTPEILKFAQLFICTYVDVRLVREIMANPVGVVHFAEPQYIWLIWNTPNNIVDQVSFSYHFCTKNYCSKL